MKLYEVKGSYRRPFIAGQEITARTTMTIFLVTDTAERAMEMWNETLPPGASSSELISCNLLTVIGTIVLIDPEIIVKKSEFEKVKELYEVASDVLPHVGNAAGLQDRLAAALSNFSLDSYLKRRK